MFDKTSAKGSLQCHLNFNQVYYIYKYGKCIKSTHIFHIANITTQFCMYLPYICTIVIQPLMLSECIFISIYLLIYTISMCVILQQTKIIFDYLFIRNLVGNSTLSKKKCRDVIDNFFNQIGAFLFLIL